jgi:hypothetical protein
LVENKVDLMPGWSRELATFGLRLIVVATAQLTETPDVKVNMLTIIGLLCRVLVGGLFYELSMVSQ